jgi:hypothetical protein
VTSTNDIASETTDQSRGLADHAQDAKHEIATSARSATSDIAGTAKEQVSAVASTAQHEVLDLTGQAKDQLRAQAEEQTRRLAQNLRQLSEQLKQMATDSGSAGPAQDLVHQAASHGLRTADFLESRGPAGVVGEVQRFARRRPGLFLLSAAVAGAAMGRMTRAAKAAFRSDDDRSGHHAGATPTTGSAYTEAYPETYGETYGETYAEPIDLRDSPGGGW